MSPTDLFPPNPQTLFTANPEGLFVLLVYVGILVWAMRALVRRT